VEHNISAIGAFAINAKVKLSGVRRDKEISLRKFKRKAPAALGLLCMKKWCPEVGVEPTRF
jgi:hypothetical protein